MTDDVRDQFERLVGELSSKVHRYCARMTGSLSMARICPGRTD